MTKFFLIFFSAALLVSGSATAESQKLAADMPGKPGLCRAHFDNKHYRCVVLQNNCSNGYHSVARVPQCNCTCQPYSKSTPRT